MSIINIFRRELLYMDGNLYISFLLPLFAPSIQNN